MIFAFWMRTIYELSRHQPEDLMRWQQKSNTNKKEPTPIDSFFYVIVQYCNGYTSTLKCMWKCGNVDFRIHIFFVYPCLFLKMVDSFLGCYLRGQTFLSSRAPPRKSEVPRRYLRKACIIAKNRLHLSYPNFIYQQVNIP